MATVATEADAESVVATLVAAFNQDPLWSWICPDPERRAAQHAAIIGLYVECALPRGGVWMSDESASAAAVFTQPGEPELSEDADERLHRFMTDELGDHAPDVLETLSRFEAAAPEGPFYYLSFLGTHPDRRGNGIGMGLLAEITELADRDGKPTYLESTNPDNNARYERLGFRGQGSFSTPDDLHTVTTMWREPVSSSR
jgi:GNAT superfamily N-acetyltransferase